MSSIIKVNTVQDTDGNNIINENANTITIGKSGDTVTVASGATLLGGGINWQSTIVTGATHTASANQGLWLDTSSNAITLTLPASPSVGDELIFTDYARNWGTNAVTLSLNGEKFQGNTSPNPVYDTNGQSVDIVYSGSTKGWIPNSDDDVTLETPQSYSIDFLVVAGGGGGGRDNAGGGGGGGMRTSTQSINAGVTITCTVAGGGNGATTGTSNGSAGANSSISGTGVTTITSAGGGNGSYTGPGGSGGSGGGGGISSSPNSGGSGDTPSTTPSQGANGGNAFTGAPSYAGGGGGGGGASGAVGANATSSSAGNGGSGSQSSITGSAIYYAGGGGAAGDSAPYVGTGGTGGGGAGVFSTSDPGPSSDGTDNLGGGGGARYAAPNNSIRAGNGGTGVVILSVPTANYSSTVTGSPTVTTSGSNTIIKFTGTGTYVT